MFIQFPSDSLLQIGVPSKYKKTNGDEVTLCLTKDGKVKKKVCFVDNSSAKLLMEFYSKMSKLPIIPSLVRVLSYTLDEQNNFRIETFPQGFPIETRDLLTEDELRIAVL